jgi:hypothetical protein
MSLVLLTLAPSCFAAETLVQSDFEGAFAANGIAEGWQDNSYTNWGTKDIAFARDTDNPRGGSACQKLTISRMGYISPERTGWADMGALQFITAQPVALRKGTVYRVRASLRATGLTAVTIQLRQAGKPWKPYIEQTSIIGAAWRSVEYLGVSSVDDPQTLFMVRFSELGSVWVDDISLEALSEAEVAALTRPPKRGNLLANGSFDLDRANWHGDTGWQNLKPTQFAIDADNGDPCLKAVGGDAGSIGIVSDVVTIVPGQPLRVSCRMRAAQKAHVRLRTVLMHAAHAEWPYTWTDAEVGPEWTTLEGSGTASFIPGTDHAYLIFTVDSAGPVWLDDVELRQDGSTEPVPVPRAAVMADRHPLALYHDGEWTALRLLSATPDGVAPPEVAWRVTDFAGEAARSGEWRPRPGRDEKRLDCTDLPRGWYRGEVVWTYAGETRRNECTFCRLPPVERAGNPDTSPFGAHFEVSPAHRALARAIGVRWVRLWPPNLTLWSTIEPEQGKWAWQDDLIHAYVADGFRLCGMLEGPPSWADPNAPGYWDQWEAYVAAVVEHCKSDIRVWEVENEPSLRWWRSKPDGPTRADSHLEALKHSYPVIKRVDPLATVIGACTAGDFARGSDGLMFAEELIADGGLQLMDALSFHYYHSYNLAQPMDEQADSTLDSTPRFRQEMRAAGRDLPIINTEGGVYNPASCLTYRPCAPDNYAPLSADTVARLIVRMYITQIASGVERFFLYNAFIDGSPVAKAWDSLIEGDGQPRPAVAAYAMMTWLLDGATFERVDRPTDDLWLYHFTTPRGRLAVVWSRTGTTTDLAIPGAGRAWDIMGRELLVKGKLRITPNPTYVLFSR